MYLVLILAGLLAGLALFGWDAARRAERAHPPLGQFIDVDGVRLHYLDSAQDGAAVPKGAPVVLLHGASGNLGDYAVSIFGPLSRRHRVIAFDRPGHGYSDRPAGKWVSPADQARLIHDAIAKLGINKPVVVGHSWGGSVALAYAIHYPDDVTGIVTLSGASHPWRGTPSFYNRLAGVPILGDVFVATLVAPGFRLSAPQALANNFAPGPVRENYLDEAGIALLVRPGHFKANAEDMRNLAGYLAEQKKKYPEISVPLTVITGNADRNVSPEVHSFRLHKAVDGSELIVLDNVGHMPHHSAPDEVVEAISRVAMRGT